MAPEQKKQIDQWARDTATLKDRLSKNEVGKCTAYARDRYAFERIGREHSLEPHWGLAAPVEDILEYTGADREYVAEMVRLEWENGAEVASEYFFPV